MQPVVDGHTSRPRNDYFYVREARPLPSGETTSSLRRVWNNQNEKKHRCHS